MTDIGGFQRDAAAGRRQLSEDENRLSRLRIRLRAAQRRLDENVRSGRPIDIEQTEIQRLRAAVADAEVSVTATKADLRNVAETFGEMPWNLVEQLSDDLPFLLLPVRIETRFMSVDSGSQLWVRILPDDIAVHTHEPDLTGGELKAGHDFWREMWSARNESDEAIRSSTQIGAWTAVVASYGSPRAAWIATQTRPTMLDVPAVDDLAFPPVGPDHLKPESWSKPPRTNVMPDRFVVMGYVGDTQVFRVAGAPVPDPLMLGPDPLNADAEYLQQDGDLRLGPDFAWTVDFDDAVRKGMGLRIPLDARTAANGLDRLLVLGLRLSSDAAASQRLIETLLDNHHYSPGGLSLLPQGTATNNTEATGSGYSSVDGDAPTSFALELGEPAFTPTIDALANTDGQRLAEALGIDYAPLQHVAHADQCDRGEARLLNTALFPATLGYYLEEMLNLELTTVGRVRDFFLEHVTGRGPLTAIRVGAQPYGLLLTSDFEAWTWSDRELGGQRDFWSGLLRTMRHATGIWRQLVPGTARIGATADPYQDLLSAIGLTPASLKFFRRQATGKETLWNFYAFTPGKFYGPQLMEALRNQARMLAADLGLDMDPLPRIFDLTFFKDHDQMLGALVDDIPADEREILSETKGLKRPYRATNPADPTRFLDGSYLDWLAGATYADLRAESLLAADGTARPAPGALLYRLLRSALLLSVHDVTTRLYDRFDVLPLAVRREVEIGNVAAERTVTRWELMDAEVGRVLPGLSSADVAVGDWVLGGDGWGQPEVLDLEDLRRALAALAAAPDLSTARLERLLVEHLDTCSYRLDAWQTACFALRLESQRRATGDHPSSDDDSADDSRRKGLYLGAFGWLEDLRPAAPLQPADLTGIPPTLHDPVADGELFEQADNGGFIHGPSLNHAVAAAVLRGAYLTHFDPDEPEKMAVNLSSARVRTASSLLDGVRSGQALGALLGYQFERGLHDRYGDPSLNQYLSAFRAKYPLLADKITPDPTNSPIETKESRNVLDGYALVEAAVLHEPPVGYPYGVQGLPTNSASPHAIALQAEVARLADTVDSVADLLLAEGVFQVTQGNFERAGASLQSLSAGGSPPDPEIAHTPRSGTAIIQRVALHLDPIAPPAYWPGPGTERARLEPGLNRWLGERLPTPDRITYWVSWAGHPADEHSLAEHALQPLDLVLMIGDVLSGQHTELETLLALAIRRDENDDGLELSLEFMTEPSDPAAVSLFELLPLLRSLRQLVTATRPLSAIDFRLPSEVDTDPAVALNPQGYDLVDLGNRLRDAIGRADAGLQELATAIPVDATGLPVLSSVDPHTARDALLALAGFGIPDALPVSAVGDSDHIRRMLAEQGLRVLALGATGVGNARKAVAQADPVDLPADRRLTYYRVAAQELFGPSFNLVPRFAVTNAAELQAAVDFRDLPAGQGLTRFHQHKPLLTDEWLQGAARVRERVGDLQSAFMFSELVADPQTSVEPLQLPHRPTDHWVAVELPPGTPLDGEFVSLLQVLPASGFDPTRIQSGLMVDEWSEVIPAATETTGIAVHYNQPSTEPPQTLLLVVAPEITGRWSWAKLEGSLTDTLQRAKQRAVEPDLLGTTAYGHLLPAVLAAVSTRRSATIATDFVPVVAG